MTAANAAEAALERTLTTSKTEGEALRAAEADAAAAKAAARDVKEELEELRCAAAFHGDALRAAEAEADRLKSEATAAEATTAELADALVEARNDAADARADAAGAQARLDEATARARDDARDVEAELSRNAREWRAEVLQARREAAEATALFRRDARTRPTRGTARSRARAPRPPARATPRRACARPCPRRAPTRPRGDAARAEVATLTTELAAARARLRDSEGQRDADTNELVRARDAAAGEAERLREKIAAVVAEGARAAAEVESADATILELRKNLEAVVGEARSRDVRARSSSARKEAEIARLAAVSEASAAELRESRPRLRALEATSADLAARLAAAEAARLVAAPDDAAPADEDAWSIAASADTVDAADAAEASTDSEVEVCAAPPTPEAVDANPRKASLLVIGAQSVDDEASTDVDSEAEAYVNDRRGRKAAAPPPTPYVVPHADDDDAVDEAPAELLFRADDTVFARDGREDHPATVVKDCPAGAASVLVKWQSTGDQVEVSIADVTAIGALPPRSCRRRGARPCAAAGRGRRAVRGRRVGGAVARLGRRRRG